MKYVYTIILYSITVIVFGQSRIATTEDGKRVILKADKTWEYIESPETKNIDSKCELPSNYAEPIPDKSIQSWLKSFDATINDLRKHIAVENDCELTEVKFLRISEQKGNGMYSVCVKGREMKYRRVGSAFMRGEEDPLSNKR